MRKKGVRLTDVVDFNRLQLLQDNFSQSTGFTSIILDENGNSITRISRPGAFSKLVDSVDHASDGCLCFTALGGIRSQTDDPLVFTCPYSGFTTVYVPVLHEGKHIANWGILQVRLNDPGDLLITKTASTLQKSEEDILSAVRQTPRFSDEALNKAVASLQALIRGLIKTLPDEKPAGELASDSSQVLQTVRLLDRFMTSVDTGMVVCDYQTGEILAINDFYATWLGLERHAAIGRRIEDLENQDFDTCVNFCTADNMLDEDGAPLEPYQWNDYSSLHASWLRCANQMVYWEDGRLAHLITFRDVTDERRMQDELSRLAYFDRQMNLPNGLKLNSDLDTTNLQGIQSQVQLICLDITSLRKLNDAHGRKAGDAFLRTVTKWITHQAPADAVLYRIDGDSFCLRLSSANQNDAVALAQKIFDRFADLWSLTINGQQISIICAVSLSVIGLDSLEDGDEVLSVMQRTLDISRKEKKVIVYNEETDRELKTHVQTQLSLKKCIKQNMNGFDVYFQPIVDPSTGTWKGLEALCRWTSPEIGAVPPLIFIREAEQLGFINLIGEWVLENSIRHVKSWGLDEIDGFFLSVNLSPVQIMSSTLINSTLHILSTYQYPGNKLSLEVTESTKLNFDNHTLGVIDKLRAHGIMIALDDFGTGYSSFNNMKNLPVRLVKTDHSFIKGIEQDYFMQYFYHIITELAHKTGMKLVVEGVETVEQLEIMMKNGVDYIQGYYFGRPMPADEMETKLDNFRRLNPPQVSGRLDIDTLDETGLDGQDSYLITTSTFNIQTRCMQILLGEPDAEKACNQVLELIGTHFNATHAFLYQREAETLLYNNSYEWCAAGAKPHKNVVHTLNTGEMYDGWMRHLHTMNMIVANDVRKLEPDIRDFLTQLGVSSMAVTPVRDHKTGAMMGFVGLDDNKYRNWLPEEIIMLKNIGMMLASLLHQQQLESGAEGKNSAKSILDHMDMPIFVSELETSRILWSNQYLRELCGQENLAGKFCYSILHGCDGRCADCHARMLLNDPSRTEVVHEFYDEGKDRTWKVYNRLIPWDGDARAQLEYSVDITDIKKAQRQMEYLASTDALSGAMNRNSLMVALPEVLAKAHIQGKAVSVIFVDVDKLKRTNDTYGHNVGDMLINKTGETLHGLVTNGDLVGRIGGDEFVLLLHKTSDEAVKLLTEARLQMRSEGIEGYENIDSSFSFGVVENTEIPYQPGNEYLRELFDIADKRMIAFKESAVEDGEVRASQFNRLFGPDKAE